MTNGPIPRVEIKEFLIDRFNMNDLEDIAFDLCVPYERLRRETKDQLVRELVQYCERGNLLGCLIIEVIKRRQQQADHLAAYLQTLPCKSLSKIQIIVPNERASEIGNLLVAFAQAHQVPLTEFKVICAAPGSIQLLMAMPSDAAAQLPSTQVALDGMGVIPAEAMTDAALQTWRRIYSGGVSAVVPTHSNVLRDVIGGVFTESVVGKAVGWLLNVLYPGMRHIKAVPIGNPQGASESKRYDFGFRTLASTLNEYLEKSADGSN